jgi:hypothetical protein
MTDAYNAGREAGIKEAADAVTREINKRYQLGVLRKRDLAELQFIRDRIDALLDSPAPAGVTVQEVMRVVMRFTDPNTAQDIEAALLTLSGDRT